MHSTNASVAMQANGPFHGIYTICPTPFHADHSIDVESIHSLTEFQIQAGVKGLAILGFLGELHKLSNAERKQVIQAYVAAAAGRVPVWTGVRALGIAGAVEQCQEAQALGSSAVFAAPLDGASDVMQFEYYRTLAQAVDIPVVIHDFPDSFSTEITAEVIARLAKEGGVNIIKMEEPPVGQKISRILELSDNQVQVFGGLGGMYFLEELQRGAVGTMTGFAFPEILVRIFNKYATGDYVGAAATFDKYCPLIRYEFQPKMGLAMRKYVYQQRGVITSQTLRSPGMRMDAITARELEAVIARVGLDIHSTKPLQID